VNTYFHELKSAGLTCVTGVALVPAITGYSLYPLAMWIGGFITWVAMRAVASINEQSRSLV